jgi:uncharacterized protein (DUF1501 family)
MKRRDFLSLSVGLPLLTTPWGAAFAQSQLPLPTPRQKLLVMIYFKGGNDNYNTVVPFANDKYRKMRPNLALARESLIHTTETQGFHSSLKALMPLFDNKELAIVQGIGQQEITNQHYRDLEMQFTGASPDEYYDHGWLTRAMVKNPQGKASTLDAVAFDDLDIRLTDPMGPFRGQKLRVVQMQHPTEWLAKRAVIGTQHEASPSGKDALKNFTQPDPVALKTKFPADPFAEALRATVLMAAADIAPPVVHITLNALDGDQHSAFDTHWDQLKFHGPTLTRLSTGLAAFAQAMKEIGRWDDTLVATYDEFGRCPKENDKQGTHHGWASAQFVLGGKVKGGLIGEAVPMVDVYALDGAPPTIDYRELYTTIIEKFWGGSANGVFNRRFKPLDLLKA